MKKDIIFIVTIIFMCMGIGTLIWLCVYLVNVAKRQYETSKKNASTCIMLNQWIKVKQQNKSIEKYLFNNKYKEIAIYGMNYIGETLLNELKQSSINIKYGIDKRADYLYSDISIVSPDDSLENVDAIIVTNVTLYDEIKKMLEDRVNCPIICLNDILYDL